MDDGRDDLVSIAFGVICGHWRYLGYGVAYVMESETFVQQERPPNQIPLHQNPENIMHLLPAIRKQEERKRKVHKSHRATNGVDQSIRAIDCEPFLAKFLLQEHAVIVDRGQSQALQIGR